MPHRAAVLALLALRFAAPAVAAPPTLVVASADPAPEWDAKFAGTDGWVGGDAAYSAALGPGRVVWLFGDSLLGTVRGGKRDAVMVANTAGVQAGPRAADPLRFAAGTGRNGKPAAVFAPPDGKGRLWPQAVVPVGDRLAVFLPQVEPTADPGAFGFRHAAQWLAEVANPGDDPAAWRADYRKVPFAEFGRARERSWGSAVLADGDFLYVYGYDAAKGARHLTAARVPAGKLGDFAGWEFRTAGGWGKDAGDAARLADGVGTEFSVCRVPGGAGYVLATTEGGLGDRVVGRFAAEPAGPWSAPLLLFRCPESRADKGLFCYAAKAHPWAAGGGLLVSYCVNANDPGRLARDAAVYRPKFVRVTFKPAG